MEYRRLALDQAAAALQPKPQHIEALTVH